MRRSLKHYWRMHLAVLLGAAVATAVLTGALLVGDSVRGSLRDLTLDRLGKIDHVILSENLFDHDLAARLNAQPQYASRFEPAIPALLLSGTAIHASSQTRATRVNLNGIDENFFALFPNEATDSLSSYLRRRSGQTFSSVIINAALQQELQAQIGDQILLSFKSYSEIPRASLLGQKETDEVLEALRLTITHILPSRGLGRFGLQTQQQLPLNAFVSLPVLQRALGQGGKVNAMLIAPTIPPLRGASGVLLSGVDSTNTPLKGGIDDALAILSMTLQTSWRLDDLGLLIEPRENFFSLTSRALILKPSLVQHAQNATNDLQLPSQTLLTYLANTIRLREHMIPYSTITALRTPVAAPFGELQLRDGSPAPQLEDDEIILNEWAARELSASRGDTIEVSYYVVGAREELTTQTHALRVQEIVSQAGLAVDRALTPPIPGVENADDMSAWEPPFPVDFKLIREQDETYWDEHRAAPKAFVSESTGRRLWRSRFGEVSALRFARRDSTSQNEFARKLVSGITLEEAGFRAQAVKAQGLQAAAGATDFGMLFIGFSFFLIISALLLLAMLFRLGVEQRGREVGTLLALGFPLAAVQRRLFSEGMFVALLGVVLGVLGGLGYAWLLLIGLRTWWVEAVGTSFLFLHAAPMSLLIGALCSLLLIALVIWRSVRQLAKISATSLMRGVTQREEMQPLRYARGVAISASALAILLLLLAMMIDATTAAGLFFGSGALFLLAGLALLSLWLRRRKPAVVASLFAMAARNNARNLGRSRLSAALVSCACFIIVAVAANKREVGNEVLQKHSGTGGFALLAQSDTPLYHNLASTTGRAALGFAEEDSALFQQTRIYALRLLPGEDASCLNLYKPEKPRVLGVTREQIMRGGFQFQALATDSAQNPWTLLEAEFEPNVIPAIGDFNSVQWILHLGLGQDVIMQNEAGEEIKLRFVGLLQSSIFQSELLISEENFLRHFPSASGHSYFLIEALADSAQRAAQVLESTLRRSGFDATATRDKLASFHAVENTYLSVFQTLGGLGLLLGTIGLGLILMRNVIERRGELATLRAFGFLQAVLTKMLLWENGFLLLWGILIGSGAALLAVAPHVLNASAALPWVSLATTLLLVFLTGMLACVMAMKLALRAALLPALKAE